jgi:transcriptional regulatory protein LEU3
LSCVRLQLRVYYFFEAPDSDLRREGLLKAFSAATSVISKVIGTSTRTRILNYAPASVCLMTFVAAIMVLKILDSSYSAFVDVEAANQLFNSALALIRHASVEDNDLPGRYSKILAQLWNLHNSFTSQTTQEPELRVKTRIGASLLHDSLWKWRETFGGQSRVSRTSLGTSVLTPN